jgi:hypothetical protein
MNDKILIIEVAVGYMLKVIKVGKPITKYKTEFASIRHGNYFEFINLIKGPLPFMVTYQDGNVFVDDKNNLDDIDFAGLLKAGQSLKIFYENCINNYGEIIDNDIPDILYCKLASFEISLRMHSNNRQLISKREELVNVIDIIGKYHKLSDVEIEALQLGRRFLNMVKHYKQQFETWQDGINAFNMALNILNKYKLTIL